jgi:hypothetical protein
MTALEARIAKAHAYVTSHPRFVRVETNAMGVAGAISVVHLEVDGRTSAVTACPELAWCGAAVSLRLGDRFLEIARRVEELKTARELAFTDEGRRVIQ